MKNILHPRCAPITWAGFFPFSQTQLSHTLSGPVPNGIPAGNSLAVLKHAARINATLSAKAGTNLSLKAIKVRFWIEMLALSSAIACSVALFFATLGAATGVGAREPEAAQSAQSSAAETHTTYEGVITDTRCGAKHSAAIGQTAPDCTRLCVHAGGRFALVDGDNTYVLEGERSILKRVAGERVKVTGTLNGDTISVTSIAAPAS
jgi:hypothetical protein